MNIGSIDFAQAFQNPPDTWCPMPFLVWNGDVSRDRITETLEQHAAQGMGGVFIHPRPGLRTDYLSEEWFDLWGFALAECKRLGLECHIYDENSYPSGFAGGHVLAENPHLECTYLEISRISEPQRSNRSSGPVLAAYRMDQEGRPSERLSSYAAQQASNYSPVLLFRLAKENSSLWKAGRSYVDLLNPETTATFLRVTHDAYAKRFRNHFGGTIRYAFADEPTVSSGGIPLSRFLLREFSLEHGYALEDKLAELCFDFGEETAAVRFDYWFTVNRLFTTNYVKQSHDWCEQHGLRFTGHYHETAWPAPKNQPSTMAALRWMQTPGNDLLGFQFAPTSLEGNGIYFLNLKELGSIARQLGRERVLTESCGGGGYDFAMRDFKVIEDFLMCFGVNLINPHLSHQSLSGARKYDWCHTLSDHAPWWEHYRTYAEHGGRVNALLNAGVEKNRLLVVHPDSSGWLLWSPEKNEHTDEKVAALRAQQIELLLELYRAGIDFDLGDEFTLAELGKVQGRKLQIGQATYEAVLIPPTMINGLDSTVQKLGEFLTAGGQIISPHAPAAYINGRKSEALNELIAEFDGRGVHIASTGQTGEMVQLALGLVSPRFTQEGDNHARANLCWRRVEDGRSGQTAWFFCNPFDALLETSVTMEGSRRWLEADTFSGSFTAEYEAGEKIHLKLPSRGHALFIQESGEYPATITARNLSPVREPLKLSEPKISPTDPNVLMIDYVDLEVNGRIHPDLNTIKADSLNFRAQGLEQNPWSFSIQYRKAFLEWPFDDRSGFKVRYHFEAKDLSTDFLRGLRLAVERPWHYILRVNGQVKDTSESTQFFDEDMRLVEIGPYCKAGRNVIELECEKFNTLAEIMPVYVLGEFYVMSEEKGFKLSDPCPLQMRSWKDMGRPFYPGKVEYLFQMMLDLPCEALSIELGELHGSVVHVQMNHSDPSQIAFPPYAAELMGPFSPGEHQLKIVVTGNLKNFMGPHHSDGLPGPWTWASSPERQPAGADYKFTDYGLLKNPVVTPMQSNELSI